MKIKATTDAEAIRKGKAMDCRDISDEQAIILYWEHIAANSGCSYQTWLLDHEGTEKAEEGFRNFSQAMKGVI